MKRRDIDLRKASCIEAGIIFALAGIIQLCSVSHGWFEQVVAFSDSHESLHLDELLIALMIMPFAIAIFAFRRLRDASRELAQRVEAEQAAQAMALHDPLTGLPNRRQVNSVLTAAIADAARHPIALALVDLNRFKAINDLQGHQVGDDLLCAVAQRLKSTVRKEDIVGRLGGDEFVIVMRDAPPGEGLVAKFESISESFQRPFQLQDRNLIVGASIGVTNIITADSCPDDALAQADAAMYSCKERGENSLCFFESGMEQAALRRAQIESELREALAEGRIEPHYQPLVRFDNGDIEGYEILARWRMDDGSFRQPEEFISVAEHTGLIGDIFYCLLRRTAQEIRDWPAHLRFAINLSPMQFSDNWLVERILQILTEEGIAPGRLEIEITESALLHDIKRAQEIIAALKKQGIRIALDDFGTGYSSLRHLNELDFDKIKIDGSFVRGIDTNESSQTIVQTLTNMAHSLGIQVTAEGIETTRDAEVVVSYGCDVGQGFLYGKPSRKFDTVMAADTVKNERHKAA